MSVLADSAIHPNEYNRKSTKYEFESRMTMFSRLALNDGKLLPNQECYKSNIQKPESCLFATNLVNFITAPIFFTQSLYDGWTIGFILGYTCAEDFGSLSECPEDEREVIEEYHKNITKTMKGLAEKSS